MERQFVKLYFQRVWKGGGTFRKIGGTYQYIPDISLISISTNLKQLGQGVGGASPEHFIYLK